MVKYYYTVNHIHILDFTWDKFMKYNPPCKECLVQGMCITHHDYFSEPFVTTKACNILYEFITNNKYFEIPESMTKFNERP